MAIMTYDEIRKSLLDETPTQFCINVELIESCMAERGFISLRECLTTKVSKGGCGLSLDKIKEFLYYNPAYRHKADTLAVKLHRKLLYRLCSGMGSRLQRCKNHRFFRCKF